MRIRGQVLALLSLFGLLYASSSAAAAVEYVRVCSVFGARYYYAPGTDSCVNAITGEVKTATQFGIMNRQTYVVARVRGLESDFCDSCFAVVRANGVLTSSEQVTSATRTGLGQFDVLFEKPTNRCAFNATLGSPDANGAQGPAPAVITVGRTPNTDNKGLSVRIYNLSGNLADRAFHLSLACEHKKPFCTVKVGNQTHDCTPEEVNGVTGLGPPGP